MSQKSTKPILAMRLRNRSALSKVSGCRWVRRVVTVALTLSALPVVALDETWQRPQAENPLQATFSRIFGDGQFEKSYALVVGVGDYDAVKKLDAPKNDALRVRDFLRKEAGFDYIVTLTDANATRTRIEDLMDTDFPSRVRSNDRFFFYFSGHGATRALGATGTSRGYLVLKTSRPGHWDEMIDMPQVREWAENLSGARHVLFVLDACFSGLLAFQAKNIDTRSVTIRRLAQPSSYFLTAGVDQEESYSFNGASLFTQAFLATARGQLDPPSDGIVSLDDMIAGINRDIDAKRLQLGSTIRMTPQLYKERIENNEGEFFFLAPRSTTSAAGPIIAAGATQAKSLDPTAGADSSEHASVLDQIDSPEFNSVDDLLSYYQRYLNQGKDAEVLQHGMAAFDRLKAKAGWTGHGPSIPRCILKSDGIELGDSMIRSKFNMVESCRKSSGTPHWWYENRRDTIVKVTIEGGNVVALESKGTHVVLDGATGKVVSSTDH